MRLWITGARGFIGRHLLRRLKAAPGHEVFGLGHGAWPATSPQADGLIDWRNGEVSHANLDALAASHGLPDGVFHLAGGSAVGPSFQQPAEDFRRSVLAASELAEWLRLRAPACALVMASSAAVYGAGHEGAIPTTAACRPFSPYGSHKRMVELLLESYARNFGVKVAIVRFFSVYGPELRKQLLWDSCTRLVQSPGGLMLGGSGEELRDWLHVDDAAALLQAAVDVAGPECPVINGGTGVATSIRAIAQALCAAWHPAAPPAVGFTGQSRPGDPRSLVADLGGSPPLDWRVTRDWHTGVQDYVDWYRRSGDRGNA